MTILNTDYFAAMRRQYAAGARGLQSMLTKAQKTGRKVGGYTAAELEASTAEFIRLSQADDATMRAHLCQARERVAARLRELRAS